MTQAATSLAEMAESNPTVGTAPIEILEVAELMMSSPVEDELMRMTEVTPVIRLDELHFILQPMDSESGPVVFKDHEGATCLQVIRALQDLCIGRMIDKIFFYAMYNGSWRKIHFTHFDKTLIKKSWPECDHGDALIGPVITPVKRGDIKASAMTDDQTSSAFGYWWQTLATAGIIYDANLNIIEDALRMQRELVAIGDATIEMRKFIGVHFLYALDQEVLKLRIQKASEREGFISVSPLFQGAGNIGWGCYYTWVDRTEQSLKVIEPGEHRLIYPEWHEYLAIIRANGGQVVEVSPNVAEAVLTTEVDMTQPHGGPCDLLKRGRYRFELVEAEDY